MAISLASPFFFPIFIAFSLLSVANFASKTLASQTSVFFTFDQFLKNATSNSAVDLRGDAVVEDSAIKISTFGNILYRKPIKFPRDSPGFSTYFCFSVSPSLANDLAFFLDSAEWRRSRLSKNVLLVEFTGNASGSDIRISVGRGSNAESCNFSSDGFVMSGGGKLHSWIEYDGFSKRIDVRLSRARDLRPSNPFISCPVDISNVLLKEAVLAGISSSSEYAKSTGRNSGLGNRIYSWSFVVQNGAPYLMHSEPLDPRAFLVASQEGSSAQRRDVNSRSNMMALLFGIFCGALVAFMVIFMRIVISCWSPVPAVECPVHPVEIDYEKASMIGEKGTKFAQTKK